MVLIHFTITFIRCTEQTVQGLLNSYTQWFRSLLVFLAGTGKTLIGVKIAFWFVQMNLKSEENCGNLNPPSQDFSESESEDNDYSEEEESYENPVFSHIYQRRSGGQKQVLFCGPSNSSVDVAASKFMIVEVISSCFFSCRILYKSVHCWLNHYLFVGPVVICSSCGRCDGSELGLFGSELGLFGSDCRFESAEQVVVCGSVSLCSGTSMSKEQ